MNMIILEFNQVSYGKNNIKQFKNLWPKSPENLESLKRTIKQ